MQLPDATECEWKECYHFVDKNHSNIQLIPKNQEAGSELESIMLIQEAYYIPKRNINELIHYHVKKYFNKENMFEIVEIIEKNKNNIIVEIKEIFPIIHIIIKLIITTDSCYFVGYAKCKSFMTEQEKEKWIKILKENVFIVPFKKAASFPGFSFNEHLNYLDSLPAPLDSWKPYKALCFNNGIKHISFIDPIAIHKHHIHVYKDFQVKVIPFFHNKVDISLFYNYAINQNTLKKQLEEQGKQDLIEHQTFLQSEKEMVFTYSFPAGERAITSVNRIVMGADRAYLFNYTDSSPEKLTPQEIEQWIQRLKTVNV